MFTLPPNEPAKMKIRDNLEENNVDDGLQRVDDWLQARKTTIIRST